MLLFGGFVVRVCVVMIKKPAKNKKDRNAVTKLKKKKKKNKNRNGSYVQIKQTSEITRTKAIDTRMQTSRLENVR